jgi:hypothetical protein
MKRSSALTKYEITIKDYHRGKYRAETVSWRPAKGAAARRMRAILDGNLKSKKVVKKVECLICPTSAKQGRFLKVCKSAKRAPILDLRLDDFGKSAAPPLGDYHAA